MIKRYHFTVEGSGGNGQTFTTAGDIECEFHHALDTAMFEVFDQLTNGRAVYGNPGMGCSGPYDIHKLTIEQVKQ